MNQEIFIKFRRFCITNGLILDTNMLILYIIGETNKNEISKSDLTARYSLELYLLIKDLVVRSKFKVPIITPHIVSETAHQLKLDTNHKKKNRAIVPNKWFNKSMDIFQSSQEEHIMTREIIKSRKNAIKELAHYGIQDLSIVDLSSQKDYAVITDDNELYDHISKKGQMAMNAATLNAIIFDWSRQ